MNESVQNSQADSKTILFLDDNCLRAERFLETHPKAVWVETAAECIELLSQEWDEVWLDHDLGGNVFVGSDREDCGMEVVRYVTKKQPDHLRETLFVVHSFNVSAAPRMVEELNAAGYRSIYRPFGG